MPHKYKQRVKSVLKEINQLPRKLTIPLGAGIFLLVMYGVTFFIEKPVQFSYAGETCVRQLSLFPNISKPTNDTGFRVEAKDTFKIGNVAVLSPKTCFVATSVPKSGVSKVSVAPFGGVFARKTFAVTVGKPPVVRAESLSKPVPIGKPLTISLSSADLVHGYQLKVGKKDAECWGKNAAIQCPLNDLGLEQGKNYHLILQRSFKDTVTDTLVSKTIKTLPATSITRPGIKDRQTIYARPTTFEFQFDKEVTGAEVKLIKLEESTKIPIKQTVRFDKKKAIMTLPKELDRNSTYRFEMDKLTAIDNSTLVKPYVATFKMSGGPKLTGTNIQTTGAGLTQTVVLSFDQPLSDAQDITKFASVKGVDATITKKSNQVIVSYGGAPKCRDFSISFAKGLESKYKIAQTEAQTFRSRTVCHTIQTIGYSRGGRPINAYYFGNGGQSVLFVGAFHGDEWNSKVIMESWIDELELRARDIPGNKQIVVVPVVNPDGIAAGTRNNSKNVDLNRNFDTSNWQKDVTSPSGQPIKNGGGSKPMSEPETQAIANLTSRLRPRVTLSYHSVAGYAIGNEAGDSGSLASLYSRLTGYQDMTGNGGAFDYSTTGTYEDWIAQKQGLPSLIIELASSVYSEFSRNRAALWAMVRS